MGSSFINNELDKKVVKLEDKLMELDKDYHSKIYFDFGDGFNEEQSIRNTFDPIFKNEIKLDLTNFKEIKLLRYDPLNDFIVATINSVKIHSDSGLTVLSTYDNNSINKDDNILYFDSKDPQLIFDLKNYLFGLFFLDD